MLGALALCAAVAMPAHAGDAKKITLTTKSDEARKAAVEGVRMIESYQFGDPLEAVAKKAIALDPDFAWAHYLLGVVTFPPPQAKPAPRQGARAGEEGLAGRAGLPGRRAAQSRAEGRRGARGVQEAALPSIPTSAWSR